MEGIRVVYCYLSEILPPPVAVLEAYRGASFYLCVIA
jgi:hypothetical protein